MIPGKAVHIVPTKPALQLGVASAALQGRIAADELDLIEENAPAGETDRRQ